MTLYSHEFTCDVGDLCGGFFYVSDHEEWVWAIVSAVASGWAITEEGDQCPDHAPTKIEAPA